MDDGKHSISPNDLYARLGSEAAPIIVDVRRDADFAGADRLVADAFHLSPDSVEQWRTELPSEHQVVTYCVHERQVSQGVATALRLMGVEADFLEGGIAAWTEQGKPTKRNIGTSPSQWVTRAHPKIDRIACPWLIRRFIDPNAEFIYVPKDQVLAVAQQTGGIPTTSMAWNLPTRVTAVRSTPFCASTTSEIQRSITWRRSSGAPIPHGTI